MNLKSKAKTYLAFIGASAVLVAAIFGLVGVVLSQMNMSETTTELFATMAFVGFVVGHITYTIYYIIDTTMDDGPKQALDVFGNPD